MSLLSIKTQVYSGNKALSTFFISLFFQLDSVIIFPGPFRPGLHFNILCHCLLNYFSDFMPYRIENIWLLSPSSWFFIEKWNKTTCCVVSILNLILYYCSLLSKYIFIPNCSLMIQTVYSFHSKLLIHSLILLKKVNWKLIESPLCVC